MHDVIFLEGSQSINLTHIFFKPKNNYSVFFYLVTIQIAFLPTIGTGTPIYAFSNIHEPFSWLCILTYFLYIYEFWSVKDVCLYYFRGISLSVSHTLHFSYVYHVCIYIYIIFWHPFFLPLRLAFTTNRFHTKQKLNYVVIIFFFLNI